MVTPWIKGLYLVLQKDTKSCVGYQRVLRDTTWIQGLPKRSEDTVAFKQSNEIVWDIIVNKHSSTGPILLFQQLFGIELN